MACRIPERPKALKASRYMPICTTEAILCGLSTGILKEQYETYRAWRAEKGDHERLEYPERIHLPGGRAYREWHMQDSAKSSRSKGRLRLDGCASGNDPPRRTTPYGSFWALERSVFVNISRTPTIRSGGLLPVKPTRRGLIPAALQHRRPDGTIFQIMTLESGHHLDHYRSLRLSVRAAWGSLSRDPHTSAARSRSIPPPVDVREWRTPDCKKVAVNRPRRCSSIEVQGG
jgi:hypothetical protein